MENSIKNSIQNSKNNDQISLRELIVKIKKTFRYLKSKWISILLVSSFGGVIGIVIASFTPVKYNAKLTFVVEESKAGGGGLSALAGQFGLDLGGTSGSSLFAGDNILLFLKSESLCRETLLTPYDELHQSTLADRYAEVKKLKKVWLKSKGIGEVNFANSKNKKLSRLQDSLLQVIINNHILINDLTVTKPDKKASFIQVIMSTGDEKLSALFSQRLVNIASNKYIESKTKPRAESVAILQRRADSLAKLLNDKTYKVANSQQVLVDMNPALRTAPINVEISTREKSMISTIFAEVVKNLEIGKSILSQETPAIQIVDQSTFPLKKIKASRLEALLFWGVLFGFLYVCYLIISKWIKSQL